MISRIFAGVLLIAAPLFSQTDRATITGTVADPSGAAIVNAVVSATNIDTNVKLETRTSADGVYTIPYLVLGTYRVAAEAAGFKRAVTTDIVLTGGAIVRADMTVEIGAVAEQIEVKAAAPQLRQDSRRGCKAVPSRARR